MVETALTNYYCVNEHLGAGERVRENVLADGQGRLPIHRAEGRLCLHTEESETGSHSGDEVSTAGRTTRAEHRFDVTVSAVDDASLSEVPRCVCE